MKKKTVALSFVVVALMTLPVMAQASESPLLGNGFQIRANNTQDQEIVSTAGLLTSSDDSIPGGTDPETPTARIGSFTYRCDEDMTLLSPIISTSTATVTWDNGTTKTELTARDSFEAESGVTYTVTTEGLANSLNSVSEFSDNCLRSVNEWPEGINTLENAFYNQRNLISVPNYLPPEVTSLKSTFGDTQNFNDSALVTWRVSNVTDMSGLFADTAFNQDISGWDVSNVEDMSGMFERNFDFNQPIGKWGEKTSKVKDMSAMFYQNPSFNQDISEWNVENVKDMSNMFGATSFNRDISEWNVGNVTNMSGMFGSYSKFNQPIGGWDVSNVSSMQSMFEGSEFNKPVDEWNTSNVTDMSRMFMESKFNQNISNWDVKKVTSYALFARSSTLATANQPKFGA